MIKYYYDGYYWVVEMYGLRRGKFLWGDDARRFAERLARKGRCALWFWREPL